MSFQKFVTQRLAAITAMINAIATNAKKIDELPVQSVLYPASKLHVSRNGNSESLEVQKIIDAAGSLYDSLVSIGQITLTGNVVTVPAGAQWKIDNIYYSNISNIQRTIPYCATGLIRKDILVANKSNDIVLVKGIEAEGIRIRPNVPLDTVLVTEMDVTDSTVGTPTNPVTGGSFVRKAEKYFINVNAPGQTSIPLYESSYIMISDFYGAFGALNYVENQNFSYVGKNYIIYNNQATNLTILHNPTGSGQNRKYFKFPNNQNLVLKPGEQAAFIEHENGKLCYLGSTVNTVTTVKPILSTALATQDVAGFVTYINSLSPVLVVAANEIVNYKTTDTGRIFGLLLRGRSFGAGQPAIAVSDVLEITEFLNKDIRLSNYPSTRNDVQLLTNRVLSTDSNGNVKMYTIATAPAPYMDVLIPDSVLPSTTTNFTIKGAFFTPTMTVAITGQTINYLTFISDKQIKVNVTTGAAEGYFNVTLDNGISRTFNGALSVVLGTIYKPTQANWIIESGIPDLSTEGEAHLSTYNSLAQAVWTKTFDYTRNFSVRFKLKPSPFGNPGGNPATPDIELIGATDGLWKYYLGIDPGNGYLVINTANGDGIATGGGYWLSPTVLEFRNYNGVFFYIVIIY